MRRGLKKRKKQRRLQRAIVLGGLVLIVTLGVLIGYRALVGNKENTNSAKGGEGEKTSAQKLDLDGEQALQEMQDEEKSAEIPDRSDFAVRPGDAPANTTQSEEKVVYLTIDDGPSGLTQQVLDILDRYEIKATFFVTGAMPEYSHMIKAAYDKGHTIGLHTYTHDYAAIYSSVDAYFADLDRIGEVVRNEIGYVPCFIRFPGGSSNTVSAKYTSGIMGALVGEVQARGYQYYDWNASTGDGAVRDATQLIAQGTSYVENNLILLAHDSASKQSTVDALPTIIEHYQSLGYRFMPIDRTSYIAHHGVNN